MVEPVKRKVFGWNLQAAERIKNNQCPVCSKPKSEWTRRRDWSCCSVECSNRIFEFYDSWSKTRAEVITRDKVCQKCGGKPVSELIECAIDRHGLGRTVLGVWRVRSRLKEIVKIDIIYKDSVFYHDIYHNCCRVSKLATPSRYSSYREGDRWYEIPDSYDHSLYDRPIRESRKFTKTPHWRIQYYDESGWIVDHILPIAIGGAEFDLNNLQLLCNKCNKEKTANDMKAIAMFRRLPPNAIPAFIESYKHGHIQQKIDYDRFKVVVTGKQKTLNQLLNNI